MDEGKKHAPAGWLEALAISEAELAAGLTVPMETVLKKLDDGVARLEATQKHRHERRRAVR